MSVVDIPVKNDIGVWLVCANPDCPKPDRMFLATKYTHSHRKLCSNSCRQVVNRHRLIKYNKSEEGRANTRKRNIELFKDPEFVKHFREKQLEYAMSPENRLKGIAQFEKNGRDPEIEKKKLEAAAKSSRTPHRRQQARNQMNKNRENPDFMRCQLESQRTESMLLLKSENLKKRWETDDNFRKSVIEATSKASRERWNNDAEYREKMFKSSSAVMTNNWKNPEFANNVAEASRRPEAREKRSIAQKKRATVHGYNIPVCQFKVYEYLLPFFSTDDLKMEKYINVENTDFSVRYNQKWMRADILNFSTNTVIEVDGWGHNKIRDEILDTSLRGLGFSVVRITNEEARTNIKYSIMTVMYHIFDKVAEDIHSL